MYDYFMKKKNIITVVFISLLILIDQISKILITKSLELNDSLNVIPNFFNLTYNKNYGAAFGILEGKRYLFLFITALALSYLIYEMRKYKESKLTYISFCIVVAGIIGNFIDRLFIGYVRDFLDFKILGYNFAIFNFADSCMVIGAIILFITIFMEEKNEKNKK